MRSYGATARQLGSLWQATWSSFGIFPGASGRLIGSTHARNRKAASGKELILISEWAVVIERIAETVLPVHTRADCNGRTHRVESVALNEQRPKQLVQHLSLLFGDRGMHIHYARNSLCYVQRADGLNPGTLWREVGQPHLAMSSS